MKLNKNEDWKSWLHYRKQKILYLLSNKYLRFTGRQRKSCQYLQSMKGKYKNKGRCFIVGNGPSLKSEDLNLIAQNNEISFASNRIYNIFDNTEWRPTFYAMFDEGVADGEGVIEGVSHIPCLMKFVRSEGYFKYRKLKNPICYVHSWWSRKYLDNPRFSDDLSKGIYTIATVTYCMIQLAAYMGFEEIYLLGMDNRYPFTMTRDGRVIRNENQKAYFEGDTKNELPIPETAASTWEMDVAYEYAEQYSKEHGFKIYNATRGGYLEAFERVDFDSLFKNE